MRLPWRQQNPLSPDADRQRIASDRYCQQGRSLVPTELHLDPGTRLLEQIGMA